MVNRSAIVTAYFWKKVIQHTHTLFVCSFLIRLQIMNLCLLTLAARVDIHLFVTVAVGRVDFHVTPERGHMAIV